MNVYVVVIIILKKKKVREEVGNNDRFQKNFLVRKSRKGLKNNYFVRNMTIRTKKNCFAYLYI